MKFYWCRVGHCSHPGQGSQGVKSAWGTYSGATSTSRANGTSRTSGTLGRK